MNTHMRGPAKTGQGAILSQRALVLSITSVAATTTLLTVEHTSKTNPIRVDLDFIVEEAFNGAGASVTVQRTKDDGTQSTVLVGTFAAGDNVKKSVLAYGRDRFDVIFAPGAGATTGKGAVYARAAGSGVLVG